MDGGRIKRKEMSKVVKCKDKFFKIRKKPLIYLYAFVTSLDKPCRKSPKQKVRSNGIRVGQRKTFQMSLKRGFRLIFESFYSDL